MTTNISRDDWRRLRTPGSEGLRDDHYTLTVNGTKYRVHRIDHKELRQVYVSAWDMAGHQRHRFTFKY